MRTASSIIEDILEDVYGKDIRTGPTARRILTELQLEQTITQNIKLPVEKRVHIETKKEKQEYRKKREEDPLFNEIYNCVRQENTAVRIYSILRRNDCDTIEKLLLMDGDTERISRMRNCGKLTSAAILDIISKLKEKERSKTDADKGTETK